VPNQPVWWASVYGWPTNNSAATSGVYTSAAIPLTTGTTLWPTFTYTFAGDPPPKIEEGFKSYLESMKLLAASLDLY
jgi:hypothetical protein